jgi:hypothetical protein
LIEITSRQQPTQRTLLDWLRVEYGIEKPGNKLLTMTDLDSDTWVVLVNQLRAHNPSGVTTELTTLRHKS